MTINGDLLAQIDPRITIFLATTLLAFISWMVKGLVEKPLIGAKETFNSYFEKRIKILSGVRVRLALVAYFPNEEGKEYKEQIQSILLDEGNAAYLNKSTMDEVIRIVIDETTNKEMVFQTIKEIDRELYMLISKVQDESDFYKKYSNYNPVKRFAGLFLLTIQYILLLTLLVSLLVFSVYGVIFSTWGVKIVIIAFISLLLLAINWFMEK